ncbi:hypothetical protein LSTR_LSTR012661 [Laodelphax striatellus]|uniref:SAM domain-containing protein n=1 Tax=Laodelphax striatellus TaxID=195883 RepID=A0A482WYP8_LAOST|nr:hypothetical protein LSTR_LSTR012661 [Laodelphax striatellus]
MPSLSAPTMLSSSYIATPLALLWHGPGSTPRLLLRHVATLWARAFFLCIEVPMERWRAPTVLAWLEIALGMPQYGPRCAENVKSGKVLLELSDVELECGLGITHPMHRKKLRLAIEEHRQPGLVRYPPIAQLGVTELRDWRIANQSGLAVLLDGQPQLLAVHRMRDAQTAFQFNVRQF